MFYTYSFLCAILSYAIMDKFGYMREFSYEGLGMLLLLVVIILLLRKPFELFICRLEKARPFLKRIIFYENIAVILVAIWGGHHLEVALIGLVVIIATVMIGTKRNLNTENNESEES